MKTEHPILFSTKMVQAILDGRKTQTRRVVKGTALEWLDGSKFMPSFVSSQANGLSPYGYNGHCLWVRETWRKIVDGKYQYKAGYPNKEGQADRQGWKPSIHMPKEASRINLRIFALRIEKLQDITEVDIEQEGIESKDENGNYLGHRRQFATLWDSINAERGYSWESNPWVWVITFLRVG